LTARNKSGNAGREEEVVTKWLAISLLVLMCLAGCGGTVQMQSDFGGSVTDDGYELPPGQPERW
jgi:hypothetical protein